MTAEERGANGGEGIPAAVPEPEAAEPTLPAAGGNGGGGHSADRGATQVIVTSAVPAYAARPPGNGMATTGLVMAIIALAISWVPGANLFLGGPCWVLGAVFSAVGWGKSGKLPGRKGRGLAIAGVAVSLAGTASFILLGTLLWASVLGL